MPKGVLRFVRWLSNLLLAIWLLGLVPGITSSDGFFLNVLSMDAWHGAAYLVAGGAGWLVSWKKPEWARVYLVGTAALFVLMLIADAAWRQLGRFELSFFVLIAVTSLSAVSFPRRLRHT